jgi:hypothetical protein
VAPSHLEGAIGPEEAQYTRGRAAFTAALVGRPVVNLQLNGGSGRATWADVRSPQWFPAHPVIRYAVSDTAVGTETASAHLPGRQSFAGWDGEAGAAAPNAGWL